MSRTGPAPEFSRMVDRREVPGRPMVLEANESERAALAGRFGLVAVKRLTATLALDPDGRTIRVAGRMKAAIVQNCAISGEELPVSVDEPISFVFVPARDDPAPDEEIELEDAELDELPYQGTVFDLGEAVAQSLALAIDPYLTGPNADSVRAEHDLLEKAPDGPLQAALSRALTGQED